MSEQAADSSSDFTLPDTGASTSWTQLERFPQRPETFTFSLLSDRTGLSRVGVFERAVEVTNLFRPDFSLQIGDSIEGYTEDLTEIQAQWAEFDQITAKLDGPLFRVPGNHDVSNLVMRDEWLRRFGALYYAFTYRGCLFLVLDTQDPPQSHEGLDIDSLYRKMIAGFNSDPHASMAAEESTDGAMPANFSDSQRDFIRETLAQHQDVRWTFVFMHMPIWQDQTDANYRALRDALGDRDFSMFAGHCHNYRQEVIDGYDHIRLGPSGGVWVNPGDEGNFDHITLVTMEDRPRIANVMLDGVLPAEGGTYSPKGIFDEPLHFDIEDRLAE